MSAMHAMALPEDDPDRQAAATCRFHSRPARSRAVRARAPARGPARAPARGPAPAQAREPAPAPVSEPMSALAPASSTAGNRGHSTHGSGARSSAHGRARNTAGSGARSSAHGRAAASQATSSRAAHAQAPRRPAAAGAPLRLTRRGRAVIAAAAALMVVMVSLIAASAAQATSHAAPPRAAEQHLSRVVVRPGQTLWSVAASADPHADTRLVIQQIVELNGLTSDAVKAGQSLWVPRG